MAHHRSQKTIFAVSSSPVRAALHVQRVSGMDFFETLVPHLKNAKTGEPLSPKRWPQPNTAPSLFRARLCDAHGSTIDDVVISAFCSPNSFTGEDVVEISSHGNPIILSKIQTLLRSLGFVDAQPGEFSERAFRNGKMDLTQVEAIHEIVSARSELAINLAHRAANGNIAKTTSEVRTQIVEALAYLEAHIDFAEDEVGTFDATLVVPALQKIAQKLDALALTYEQAARARNGVRVCFAGKPNAGKSSLFNALLKKDRAIVTDIPGTTRDVLEDHFLYRNRDFVLLDTAGLRETSDVVERMGVHRSNEQIKTADIVIAIIDVSAENSSEQASLVTQNTLREITNVAGNQSLIAAISKQDITPPHCEQAALNTAIALGATSAVAVSRENPDNLLEALSASYDTLANSENIEHTTVLISARQRDKVVGAATRLHEAIALAQTKGYPESIASVVNQAKCEIEEIVGIIAPNDVLETLFSHFCIGK